MPHNDTPSDCDAERLADIRAMATGRRPTVQIFRCDFEFIFEAIDARDAEIARLRSAQPAPDAADEVEVQELYSEAQQLGAAAERARIVAWLHKETSNPAWGPVAQNALSYALTAIERGEHAQQGEAE